MRVCALVDSLGALGRSPCEEYAEIKEQLCLLLQCEPGEVFFHAGLFPHQLANRKVDIYIIDFGGVLPGTEHALYGHLRTLLEQIEDKPSTLFIIWSSMSARWYAEAISEFSPEFKAPNVLIARTPDWERRVRDWFVTPAYPQSSHPFREEQQAFEKD